MAYLKIQALLDELAGHRKLVFRISEVSRITGKPTGYLSKILSRNEKVKRVERGVYYMVGLNRPDIYEIASNIVFPSYISMFSAFQFYSLTEQSVVRYSVVTIKRHRKTNLEGNHIEFITFPKKRFFGYTKVGNSYVATVEKAIVDSLYMGSPPYEYVDEAFAKALQRRAVNIGMLIDFTTRMESPALEKEVLKMLNAHGIKAPRLKKKVRNHDR
jgi:predicted transcriptional regulator of viral defense system